MTKIILQGYITVPDSVLEEVKSELVVHKRLTLEESGCITFSVEQDEVVPNRFNVYEEFINKTAFDNHQERVKSSNWGEITKGVERHYQISNGE